jgi:hypothetical protein
MTTDNRLIRLNKMAITDSQNLNYVTVQRDNNILNRNMETIRMVAMKKEL